MATARPEHGHGTAWAWQRHGLGMATARVKQCFLADADPSRVESKEDSLAKGACRRSREDPLSRSPRGRG
eukprot:7045520-Pyramimonas_sp.AAC.1